jgi:crotonobetainyl-CoA:carnitine CoA-transferase CaiB-like acyl-CoA transferase
MRANEASVPTRHAALGDLDVPGVPVKLSGTPGSVRLAPPVLGQDTDALLEELGYPAERIEELREAGAVA